MLSLIHIYIRNHRNQVRGYHVALGCQGFNTTAKSEEQACLRCSPRGELSENDCRNRDEALSYDNAGTELVNGCQSNERSTESCQESGQDDADAVSYTHLHTES